MLRILALGLALLVAHVTINMVVPAMEEATAVLEQARQR